MKIIKPLLISFILVLFAPFALVFAEEERNWYDAIGIGFGMTGIMQGTSGLPEDRADYAYSVDLEFSGEIAEGQNLFLIMESGNGDGANGNVGSRSIPNYDSFVSLFEGEQRLNVSQVYYEGNFLDGKMTAAFGLMDHHALYDTNAFANDETEQFINGTFVRTAGSLFPEHENYYAYTFMLAARPIELVSLSYSYAKHNTEDFFSKGLHVFELGLHPKFGSLDGNYSVDFLLHDIGFTNYRSGKRENNKGIIVNVDQMLHEYFGVFGRFAFAKDTLLENEVTSMWSVGAQINGDLWRRQDDVIGLAYGQLELNRDIVGEFSEGEKVMEFYYKLGINDHVHLTADIQYLSDLERASNRDVVVFSFRSQISF